MAGLDYKTNIQKNHLFEQGVTEQEQEPGYIYPIMACLLKSGILVTSEKPRQMLKIKSIFSNRSSFKPFTNACAS